MSRKILVTGGAGFIGSFIVDKLIEQGNDVRIFDSLEPQVHGDKMPDYLDPKAEFIRGDVNDAGALKDAVSDMDVVFHMAALVGVGQSMYQIKRYVEANTLGTSNLLDILVNSEHDVKKLVVASSMSTYGEGSYECENCGEVHPPLRPESQMQKNDWELHCPVCDKHCKPIPTKESKTQEVNSIYAITKKDQEDMVLNIGKTYGIPSVALRFFNVYGPRQSLSNPYTGVAAIFMSRIKNANPPIIFEDGNQSRDFISVHDIADANILAMKHQSADYEVFNVGTGNKISILEVAETISRLYKKSIMPKLAYKFRKGDVRHCFADISKIRDKIGFDPKVSFSAGMGELIDWAGSVDAVDRVDDATDELQKKGLLS
ncbi:MAG TPA: NAD-dependent epimerase/dehydratase family protein [Candidatus Nanoarchaeia archaeon]|nr:NAD-dependent epimerase/dehydratase family protein [Candidatus Nanoarchaeia archaeon]